MRIAIISAFVTLTACGPAPEDRAGDGPGTQVGGPVELDLPEPTAAPAPALRIAADHRWSRDETRAAFGAPESDAILAFECTDGEPTVQRIVEEEVEPGRAASMNFLGRSMTVPVLVRSEPSEIGGSAWRGAIPDTGRLASVIEGARNAVEVNIEGGDPIRLRPSRDVADFLRDCA